MGALVQGTGDVGNSLGAGRGNASVIVPAEDNAPETACVLTGTVGSRPAHTRPLGFKKTKHIERNKGAIERMADSICDLRDEIGSFKTSLSGLLQRQYRELHIDEELALL